MLSRKFICVATISALTVLCQSGIGQTETEKRFVMEKARALYYAPVNLHHLSCEVKVDWAGFATKMGLGDKASENEVVKALNAISIHVDSPSEGETTVAVAVPQDMSPKVAEPFKTGFHDMFTGFFQMYWPFATGEMLPKRESVFELTKEDAGYLITYDKGGKVMAHLGKDSDMTLISVDSPALKADMKTHFAAGPDGLLRLRTLDELVTMGESRMNVHIGLDYQHVDGLDVPEHINMSMPGSYSFDFTLTGCSTVTPAKN